MVSISGLFLCLYPFTENSENTWESLEQPRILTLCCLLVSFLIPRDKKSKVAKQPYILYMGFYMSIHVVLCTLQHIGILGSWTSLLTLRYNFWFSGFYDISSRSLSLFFFSLCLSVYLQVASMTCSSGFLLSISLIRIIRYAFSYLIFVDMTYKSQSTKLHLSTSCLLLLLILLVHTRSEF